MKRRSLTVFLLLSELSLTGIMMGLGLVLLAGTVSITSVTTINDDNLTPFIKLWGTTALYLLIVGTQLIVTILLLYTFIGVAYHKYQEVDQENSVSDMGVMIKLQQSRRYAQLRKRCNVWLLVAIPHLVFVASQFLWPIPTYQFIYYGVLVGFKLMVIGAVVSLRNWISVSGVQDLSPSRGDTCGVKIMTASNTKGLCKVKLQRES